MAQYLKPVSSTSPGFTEVKKIFDGTQTTQINGETLTVLSGSSLSFTEADRTNTTTSQWGNIYATFKLPVLDTNPSQKPNWPYASKTLFDTTFVDTTIENFNQDKVIFANIPKNEYGEAVVGGSITLDIPVSGSVMTVRGVYLDNNSSILAAYDTPLESGGRYSETLGSISHAHASTVKSSTDNSLNSNVVYLYSDDIAPPVRGGSWETGTTFTPLGFDDNETVPRKTALPSNNGTFSADTAVGVAYLDKGFVVLTHPTIVNNFDWPTSARENVSNITNSQLTYKSFVTEFVQRITITLEPGEFYDTDNPTYTSAMRANGDPVYGTSIGLYNSDGELIGIAKPSQPIAKDFDSTVTATIEIKL